MRRIIKMSCNTININKNLLSASIGSAVIIIIGMVESDHFLDKQGIGISKVGMTMFTLGWVLMAVLVSVNKQTGKFDWNLFLKRGLPALVVFATAIVSQKIMMTGGGMNMLGGLGLLLMAWMFFASMLVHTETSQKKARGLLIYGGAVLVNIAIIALFLNRKYNVMSGKWDGPENVFGMGLPLLTIGWVSVCAGISLC